MYRAFILISKVLVSLTVKDADVEIAALWRTTSAEEEPENGVIERNTA